MKRDVGLLSRSPLRAGHTCENTDHIRHAESPDSLSRRARWTPHGGSLSQDLFAPCLRALLHCRRGERRPANCAGSATNIVTDVLVRRARWIEKSALKATGHQGRFGRFRGVATALRFPRQDLTSGAFATPRLGCGPWNMRAGPRDGRSCSLPSATSSLSPSPFKTPSSTIRSCRGSFEINIPGHVG